LYLHFIEREENSIMFLFLYVKNILIIIKYKNEIRRLKEKLNSRFEMKTIVLQDKMLRMDIKRDQVMGKLC